jgi:hypothetical protein
VIEEHFPELYQKADKYSDRWQKRYLSMERLQLVALVLAAGAFGFGSIGRLVVVISFAIATFAHLYRYQTKADQKWWNGRAGAESAKTLCWRYAVAGAPFGLENAQSDTLFATRLAETAWKVAEMVPVSVSTGYITNEMKTARSQPLNDRISIYQTDRIRGQMEWYSAKSEDNVSRGRNWAAGTIFVQATGLVLGVLGLVNEWNLDFVGILTAVAASSAAWVAVKQHDVLARSYAVASNELALITEEISARSWTEGDWALYVDNAEEAISREHTSWRASRAV